MESEISSPVTFREDLGRHHPDYLKGRIELCHHISAFDACILNLCSFIQGHWLNFINRTSSRLGYLVTGGVLSNSW